MSAFQIEPVVLVINPRPPVLQNGDGVRINPPNHANRMQTLFNTPWFRTKSVIGFVGVGIILITIASTRGDLNQAGTIAASVGLAALTALGCMWASAPCRRIHAEAVHIPV